MNTKINQSKQLKQMLIDLYIWHYTYLILYRLYLNEFQLIISTQLQLTFPNITNTPRWLYGMTLVQRCWFFWLGNPSFAPLCSGQRQSES